ncbi:MAG: bifunctional adenosylcobinamide kinase/adenosylcobinamide-phosphate guanylyltransferase [Gemmatimonadota bacterium]|nr:bifunctional adenosylcobinamide kinase/adenosylcobinamide-phosphate guanylyltransferase [Gemmatimonadota bacterium]
MSQESVVPRVRFLVGGARSGKSRLAVEMARSATEVLFVATARGSDEDMRRRIARHREERPAEWRTLEAPVRLPEAIRRDVTPRQTVILDCLTFWVSNLMAERGTETESVLEERVLERADALVEAIGDHGRRWIVVSNEVGTGLHPETPVGRRYRDLLGQVNQRIADAADRSLLVVAGQVLPLRPAPEG